VKSDLQIVQELAQRVGLTDVMAGGAREWKERMISPKLGSHGVTVEMLEAGAIRNPLAVKVLFAERKFKTPTGRVNLITKGPAESQIPQEYPLTLMSLSTPWSQSSQWAVAPGEIMIATVHPESSEGIPEGKTCLVESEVTSIRVCLQYDASQRRDVLLTPKGGHFFAGQAANALVKARTTDIGEGGALYDEKVRLVPLSGED
jgi:hypothetical protein